MRVHVPAAGSASRPGARADGVVGSSRSAGARHAGTIGRVPSQSVGEGAECDGPAEIHTTAKARSVARRAAKRGVLIRTSGDYRPPRGSGLIGARAYARGRPLGTAFFDAESAVLQPQDVPARVDVERGAGDAAAE